MKNLITSFIFCLFHAMLWSQSNPKILFYVPTFTSNSRAIEKFVIENTTRFFEDKLKNLHSNEIGVFDKQASLTAYYENRSITKFLCENYNRCDSLRVPKVEHANVYMLGVIEDMGRGLIRIKIDFFYWDDLTSAIHYTASDELHESEIGGFTYLKTELEKLFTKCFYTQAGFAKIKNHAYSRQPVIPKTETEKKKQMNIDCQSKYKKVWGYLTPDVSKLMPYYENNNYLIFYVEKITRLLSKKGYLDFVIICIEQRVEEANEKNVRKSFCYRIMGVTENSQIPKVIDTQFSEYNDYINISDMELPTTYPGTDLGTTAVGEGSLGLWYKWHEKLIEVKNFLCNQLLIAIAETQQKPIPSLNEPLAVKLLWLENYKKTEKQLNQSELIGW